MRDVGTEINWDECEMDDKDDNKVDDEGVTCNLWNMEDELNCKLYPGEKGISMKLRKKINLQYIVFFIIYTLSN